MLRMACLNVRELQSMGHCHLRAPRPQNRRNPCSFFVGILTVFLARHIVLIWYFAPVSGPVSLLVALYWLSKPL